MNYNFVPKQFDRDGSREGEKDYRFFKRKRVSLDKTNTVTQYSFFPHPGCNYVSVVFHEVRVQRVE